MKERVIGVKKKGKNREEQKEQARDREKGKHKGRRGETDACPVNAFVLYFLKITLAVPISWRQHRQQRHSDLVMCTTGLQRQREREEANHRDGGRTDEILALNEY